MMHLLTIDALNQHWERATADARITDNHSIDLDLKNITAFTLNFPEGQSPFPPSLNPEIKINGATPQSFRVAQNKPFSLRMGLVEGTWRVLPGLVSAQGRDARPPADDVSNAKRHRLQGPIDDAFLDPFLIVKPSRPALNPTLEAWTKHELYHASTQWRAIFRGLPREKNDHELTDADIANHNLILFGDPASNATLAKIADKLPIKWTRDHITLNNQTYPSTHHVPILIHPNPLNPSKYVVLNSGFTFRPPGHPPHTRQIPRHPDYALPHNTQPPPPASPAEVLTPHSSP